MPIDLPDDLTLEMLDVLFGNEAAYAIRPNEEDEESVFPDGTAAFFCTNWANYVRRVAGARAKLYGFFRDDNPTSQIARDFGGHDFAVLDDRFIVDCWALDLGCSTQAVFDLEEPDHAAEIQRLYGDRPVWKHNAEGEASIDGEPPAQRAAAMAGTGFSLSYPAPTL